MIGLDQASYTVREAGGAVEVCAIAEIVNGTVVVTLSTEDNTAIGMNCTFVMYTIPHSYRSYLTAPMDYLAISEPLSFNPATTRVCRNITIVDDSDRDSGEVFFLRLTTNEPGVVLDPNSGTVAIIDNEG